MKYRLIVLTHGDGGTLGPTLESFKEMVAPHPTEAFIYADGAAAQQNAQAATRRNRWARWSLRGSSNPRGFCYATWEAWEAARWDGVDYIYWLEHDFVHVRPVDLHQLAATLELCPHLAQVALRRNPVSPEEVAAGGVVEMRAHQHQPKRHGPNAWLEHDIYWTTNPSLFKREIPLRHGWVDEPECEGKFGIRLHQQRPGTKFGVWGELVDKPWVEHIGVRTGFNY